VEPASYRCGQFHVDAANRRFVHDGREIALEPRVFAVIAQLLAKPGVLIARHELLDAVWGHRYVTPSTLNRTIALARRAFGDDVDEPHYIQTVHGAGYRYVGPIEVLNADGNGSPARFGPPPIARLPARIEALIGRETELATLAQSLLNSRAVTVLGTGGMGKTQCALEAARRAATEFSDGVWFFDLAALQHGEQWLQALGAALALPPAGAEALLEKLRPLLHSRRALFVLDNCDRVAPRVGELVFELLRATEVLKILATSQEPLNFAGEQLLRMPPLALPPRTPTGRFGAAAVADAPAVAMLVTRIRAVVPEFEVDDANATAIAEICHRLDGMPLALELAAARFAFLSPEQVLERLDQRFRFLGSDTAGRDHRHRSLLSLLEWSYALLSAEEQRLLEWCSVFVQSWTVDATLGMAAALAHDAEVAVDLLAGLVNRSLVSVVPGTAPPRYRLLETVREYALARIVGTNQEALARAAHLRVVLHMCRAAHADMRGGRMRERIEQLTQEHGNIAAALETAKATTDGQAAALDILGSLVLYAKAHGAYISYTQWCREVLARSEPVDTPERARALLTYGVMQVHVAAEYQSIEAALPEAARIAATHQDWWTEAYAHGYYALGLANWGRPQEAEAHAALTELQSRRHKDALLGGLAGLARGWIRLSRGEAAAALTELGAVRSLGPDLHQQHFIEVYIGLSHFALGDLPAAARQWLQGMRLGAAVGNVRGIAGSIEGCGYLVCKMQDWISCARLLAAAQLIRERTGVPLFNFWLPHQEAALTALRANLQPREYAAAWQAGAALRQEDVAEEAQALLWRMSGNAERRASQRGTNRPPGS
jgi:predicted ATPase/DNA-binding winged helix-turn-helix (wHTH) protein